MRAHDSSGTPPRKVDALAALMRAGQWERALAMAARWPRLGVEREAIQRAASALLSPVFYRAIGEDPAALIENGKAALRRRYAAYLGEDDERKG